MQLFVRGQAPHVVDVRGEETVGELRAQLCALEGVAAEQARLSVGGVALADDVLVNSIQAEIELDVGLLGGKVHGSLARAGKVKGQTPKVEAQEKRKKKTGRAKRRIQYRRRFVTVVQTQAPKKVRVFCPRFGFTSTTTPPLHLYTSSHEESRLSSAFELSLD